ncbi:MAG: hypothetical protein MJZ37_08890 [Bacilli bacterium]|nr:hypothetical protein [Bacilli bacterium]
MKEKEKTNLKECCMVMEYVKFYRALGKSYKTIAKILYNDFMLISYIERDEIASWED